MDAGQIARRFLLIARRHPACLRLTDRVREFTGVAHSARKTPSCNRRLSHRTWQRRSSATAGHPTRHALCGGVTPRSTCTPGRWACGGPRTDWNSWSTSPDTRPVAGRRRRPAPAHPYREAHPAGAAALLCLPARSRRHGLVRRTGAIWVYLDRNYGRKIHVHGTHGEDASVAGQQRATDRWKGLAQ